MTYTTTDLDNVHTAIIALSTGSRMVSLSMGDKTVTYGQAQLDDLRALRAEIIAEIGTGGGRPNSVLIKTSKGL